MLGKCLREYCMPHRYLMSIMAMFGVINGYSMRIFLSLLITEMVPLSHDIENTTYNPDVCEKPKRTGDEHLMHDKNVFNWDEKAQGIILSSFYWGYLITHLPGGLVAERFGGKQTLGIGLLITAILTILTPSILIATDGNIFLFVVIRFVEGLGEGTMYPALNVLLACWVPLEERARAGTLVYAGAQLGMIFSNMIGALIAEATGNWKAVFYFFGIIGLIWYLLWTIMCYSTPADDPYISEDERTYIHQRLASIVDEDRVHRKHMSTPWKAILTSIPLWALIVAEFGHDWGFYIMITDLPKYMKDVLGFDVRTNGIWSSVPYGFMWLASMIGGWSCDYFVTHDKLTVTNARKIYMTLASVLPSVFLVIASYSGCDRVLATAMLTLAITFMGMFYNSLKINALDLSPNHAGTLMAMVNGIGSIAGIIAPYIVGIMTPNQTVMQWRIVFWITFVIFSITNIVYLMFGSGDVQPWNFHQDN